MGRRPIADERARLMLRLRVTPAQRTELQRIAKDNGVTVSGLLRDALLTHVAEREEQRAIKPR